jgi:hypothetical protein
MTDQTPIALNDAQIKAAQAWAADHRLWTTQETVEFNLQIFARLVLAETTSELVDLRAERDRLAIQLDGVLAGAETLRADVRVLHCSACGKPVSTGYHPVPTDTPDRGLIVRAWIACPECLENKALR